MIPKATAETQKPGERRDRRTFRATLGAILDFPLSHFPLFLPGVHPIAAFFILRRLKRRGYSNCTVHTTAKGLVVHAQR
ncbi:hypothetical protein FO488_13985 [Geobacter sp. FeAm09]|uniref:hypothetical protein n=1 Tax=Geobacter sp. FeAm09 TaxID=2597769 RepID=UPI0011EE52DF|nr:hypothetical protein [Geobacter sp. FeAm09]QEM69159.1 hypothetical protein FO488_13985 [Geobacter sp. FeAm09]